MNEISFSTDLNNIWDFINDTTSANTFCTDDVDDVNGNRSYFPAGAQTSLSSTTYNDHNHSSSHSSHHHHHHHQHHHHLHPPQKSGNLDAHDFNEFLNVNIDNTNDLLSMINDTVIVSGGHNGLGLEQQQHRSMFNNKIIKDDALLSKTTQQMSKFIDYDDLDSVTTVNMKPQQLQQQQYLSVHNSSAAKMKQKNNFNLSNDQQQQQPPHLSTSPSSSCASSVSSTASSSATSSSASTMPATIFSPTTLPMQASPSTLASSSTSTTTTTKTSAAIQNDDFQMTDESKDKPATDTPPASQPKTKKRKRQSDRVLELLTSNSDDAGSTTTTTTHPSIGVCKICGDRASGFHYGIASCEGCKGFFRRSIQKQMNYKCVKDGTCVISLANRNRCQHCRFKRCLDMGMSRECVRVSSVHASNGTAATTTATMSSTAQQCKKISSQHLKNSIDSSCMSNDGLDMYGDDLHQPTQTTGQSVDASYLSQQLNNSSSQSSNSQSNSNQDNVELNVNLKKVYLYELTLKVAQINRLYGLTGDHERLSQNDVMTNGVKHIDVGVNSEILRYFATCFDSVIMNIIDFARHIPGYSDLDEADKIVLIKANSFKILVCKMCFMFTTNGSLVFDNGYSITKEQLEILYDADFLRSIHEFSKNFFNAKLNDIQLGLLCAILLTQTGDDLDLQMFATIKKMNFALREAFKLEIQRKVKDTNESDEGTFKKTVDLISDLQRINYLHHVQLDQYRNQNIKLPFLFSEIYELENNTDNTNNN